MFLLDRLFRRIVQQGELIVTGPDGSPRRYGTPDPAHSGVSIRVDSNRTARAIAINPALGASEAYMDGRLTFERGDIRQLLDLVTFNLRWDRDNPVRFALWRQASIAAKIDQINFSRRSKRNVAHHYDLDDRLYDLFLDPQRQYSCAYFTDPGMGLDAAQEAKLAHIAAKLDLKPGQRCSTSAAAGAAWRAISTRCQRRRSARRYPVGGTAQICPQGKFGCARHCRSRSGSS